MCSPRGLIAEFARLKEAITQAGGAQGKSGYQEILGRHGVECPSQFKSSQPARLCAKELFLAIQTFEQASAVAGNVGVAESLMVPAAKIDGISEVEGGKQNAD